MDLLLIKTRRGDVNLVQRRQCWSLRNSFEQLRRRVQSLVERRRRTVGLSGFEKGNVPSNMCSCQPHQTHRAARSATSEWECDQDRHIDFNAFSLINLSAGYVSVWVEHESFLGEFRFSSSINAWTIDQNCFIFFLVLLDTHSERERGRRRSTSGWHREKRDLLLPLCTCAKTSSCEWKEGRMIAVLIGKEAEEEGRRRARWRDDWFFLSFSLCLSQILCWAKRDVKRNYVILEMKLRFG